MLAIEDPGDALGGGERAGGEERHGEDAAREAAAPGGFEQAGGGDLQRQHREDEEALMERDRGGREDEVQRGP